MSTESDPRQLLKQFDLRPRKGLGQNFMVGRHAIEQVLAAADLHSDDSVLEIGPGLGTLTSRLLERAGQVVAVELDSELVRVLKELLGNHPRLRIIAGDILETDPASLFDTPYKVVANIPYYITSAVLRHLLEAAVRPSVIVLTMQREVAQRIVDRERLSLLAVSVQFYGAPRIVARIPSGAFHPPPKVDSAVLRVDVHPTPAVAVHDTGAFFRVVKAGFSAPRKQLRNALANGLRLPAGDIEAALQRAGIDPRRRAETISIPEWRDIQEALGESTPPAP
jgi:16S rRNA (adenine1518-N6/adenine1519-N6)-dimethyltransferase